MIARDLELGADEGNRTPDLLFTSWARHPGLRTDALGKRMTLFGTVRRCEAVLLCVPAVRMPH